MGPVAGTSGGRAEDNFSMGSVTCNEMYEFLTDRRLLRVQARRWYKAEECGAPPEVRRPDLSTSVRCRGARVHPRGEDQASMMPQVEQVPSRL
jgi:hypothetical protein